MLALEFIVISLFIFLSPVLLYATARDLTSTLSDSERRDFDTLFQLLDRADHFVVGFDPFGEGADDTLIALRGAFEPSHLDVFTEFTEREAFRNHELRGRGSAAANATRSGAASTPAIVAASAPARAGSRS